MVFAEADLYIQVQTSFSLIKSYWDDLLYLDSIITDIWAILLYLQATLLIIYEIQKIMRLALQKKNITNSLYIYNQPARYFWRCIRLGHKNDIET